MRTENSVFRIKNFLQKKREAKQSLADEFTFKEYLADLKLSEEDLSKKILDVGSGEARFANWVSKNKGNSNVFSLEHNSKSQQREVSHSVYAQAEHIPFPDETFDLVISDCAIPNVFLAGDLERVRSSLLEMFRVTKKGGEVRLGKVLLRNEYESQRELTSSIEKVAIELKNNYGARIKVSNYKELNDAYLIKIYKPS